jgi:hypothetical protein
MGETIYGIIGAGFVLVKTTKTNPVNAIDASSGTNGGLRRLAGQLWRRFLCMIISMSLKCRRPGVAFD